MRTLRYDSFQLFPLGGVFADAQFDLHEDKDYTGLIKDKHLRSSVGSFHTFTHVCVLNKL